MAEDSGISWTHNTQNFWIGCDKVAPECAKCYIARILQKQGREPWGEVYRTQTWEDPWDWEAECLANHYAKRVFTCSLSDFFHAKADPWREQAWRIIKRTPHLVWLILTKRPELIEARLPHDWGNGYPNVWLGVSVGTRQTLIKMDTLRRIPAAVRWISAEPLLEDISADINLDGFRWVVVGGESGGRVRGGDHGSGLEYLWNPAHWKAELKAKETDGPTYADNKFLFCGGGRRTMKYKWAANLRDKVKASGLTFMFKQVTAARSGFGYNALDGKDWHEFPPAPNGLEWAPRQPIPDKCKMRPEQWQRFKHCGSVYPYPDSTKSKARIPKAQSMSDLTIINLLSNNLAKFGHEKQTRADLEAMIGRLYRLKGKELTERTDAVIAEKKGALRGCNASAKAS